MLYRLRVYRLKSIYLYTVSKFVLPKLLPGQDPQCIKPWSPTFEKPEVFSNRFVDDIFGVILLFVLYVVATVKTVEEAAAA